MCRYYCNVLHLVRIKDHDLPAHGLFHANVVWWDVLNSGLWLVQEFFLALRVGDVVVLGIGGQGAYCYEVLAVIRCDCLDRAHHMDLRA